VFFVLRYLGWLQWWQVVLAGAFCSLPFILIYILVSGSYHVEIYGLANSLVFIGLGGLVGVVFWWTSLFRNSRFPAVSRNVPLAMLLLIPIAFIGWLANRSLNTELIEGRVAEVPETVQGDQVPRVVLVQLANAQLVQARVPPDGLNLPIRPGNCVVMESRSSALFKGRLYWLLMHKLGEHYNDC